MAACFWGCWCARGPVRPRKMAGAHGVQPLLCHGSVSAGFWCCSSSLLHKELGGSRCPALVLAAQVSGAAPVPRPTRSWFAALSWQGAGRAPRHAASVASSPPGPSWRLCRAGSGPGEGTGHSLMRYAGAACPSIQTAPAAKGKRGKESMGREDRPAAALRLDQCRPSGNVSQISGPGACAC